MAYSIDFKNKFFQILAILTVGFPFIGYKFLAGYISLHMFCGTVGNILAVLFFMWALSDIFFNVKCLFAHFIKKRDSSYPVCFWDYFCKNISYFKRYQDLGETLDTFFSFAIVALVVGFNLFIFMNGFTYIWNIATVVNVLGAGIFRLGMTFLSKY